MAFGQASAQTMFSLSVFAFTLLTVVFATPTPREPGGLSVSLSVKETQVATVEDIVVDATVTNSGSEEVRFFKYNTVLDDLPTQSFVVTTKNGTEVPFTGIRISVDTEEVGEEAYVVIPPGESVTTSHQVGQWYDFESAGIGSFIFAPETNFVVVNPPPEGENSTALALADVEVESTTVEVEVTESVAPANPSEHERRATFTCPNPARAAIIKASYNEAKSLALRAYNWIPGRTNTALYKAYWKTNTAVATRSRFLQIYQENLAARKIGCTDTAGGCTAGVRAYAFVAFPNNIVFCPHFFDIQVPVSAVCGAVTVNARRVRGGIAIHELSHAVVKTKDYSYGCPSNQQLIASRQIANADNYHCFTTQLYKSMVC